jgi:hypothetical protein
MDRVPCIFGLGQKCQGESPPTGRTIRIVTISRNEVRILSLKKNANDCETTGPVHRDLTTKSCLDIIAFKVALRFLYRSRSLFKDSRYSENSRFQFLAFSYATNTQLSSVSPEGVQGRGRRKRITLTPSTPCSLSTRVARRLSLRASDSVINSMDKSSWRHSEVASRRSSSSEPRVPRQGGRRAVQRRRALRRQFDLVLSRRGGAGGQYVPARDRLVPRAPARCH